MKVKTDARLACAKCGRTVSLTWARDRGWCPSCYATDAYSRTILKERRCVSP